MGHHLKMLNNMLIGFCYGKNSKEVGAKYLAIWLHCNICFVYFFVTNVMYTMWTNSYIWLELFSRDFSLDPFIIDVPILNVVSFIHIHINKRINSPNILCMWNITIDQYVTLMKTLSYVDKLNGNENENPSNMMHLKRISGCIINLINKF